MATQTKTYSSGAILFREGDPSRSLFLVQSGRISIRKNTESGEIEIAQVTTNQLLGELSFFDRKDRSASAVALENSNLVEIEFDSLQSVYDQMPDYLKKFMMSLSTRLREADEMIRVLKEQLGQFSPKPKVSETSEAEDILAATEKK